MSDKSLKIKKFVKVLGITIGIMALFFIAVKIYIYKMENRPFPLNSLELKDGLLEMNFISGCIDYFRARVTNKEKFGVKDIEIRIDIFDKKGNSIDGRLVEIHEVPANSTRYVTGYSKESFTGGQMNICDLPPNNEWTWAYKVKSAKRTW
jgi:hypothetical protein